jgi:hypothetical protein
MSALILNQINIKGAFLIKELLPFGSGLLTGFIPIKPFGA